MTATDIAAWYGAISSTALLATRIVREMQERRRRKFWASRPAANLQQGATSQLAGIIGNSVNIQQGGR